MASRSAFVPFGRLVLLGLWAGVGYTLGGGCLAQGAETAPAPAVADAPPKDAGTEGIKKKDKDDEPDPVPSHEIADALRRHTVRVRFFARRDDGLFPQNQRFAVDMLNERPTFVGGFWWDGEGRVVLSDPILPDAFLRRIELEFDVDGQTRTVPARIVGRHPRAQLMLLQPTRPLPEGVVPAPPAFAPAPERKAWGKMRVYGLFFEYETGRWFDVVGGGPQRLMRFLQPAEEFINSGSDSGGLLVDTQGRPVGYAHTGVLDTATPAEGGTPWRAADVRMEDFVTPEALVKMQRELHDRLSAAMPEVRFGFRQRIEDEDSHERGRYANQRNSPNAVAPDAVEYRATGWRVGPRHVLVPAELTRDLVAKIESIRVVFPDGTRREGVFDGAARLLMAVRVRIEGDDPLPGESLWTKTRPGRRGEFFVRARVGHETGRRKERFDYDRWRGEPLNYRGFPGVLTYTNEGQGDLAFGLDGALLAMAVGLRPPAMSEQMYYLETNAAFRPAGMVEALMAAPDAIDETIIPKEEEEGRRLVAFGVEAQGLNANLAKWFGAEAATRGGQIGMLVTYVYPDSPAAQLGLREHDILLRLTPPNRMEPVDLGGGSTMPWYNPVADAAEALRSFEREGWVPPFWPSPENRLTTLLTSYGPGREVSLEYVREGQVSTVAFTTEMGPPDFRSAPKHRSKPLGLTVKPVTYEVARFMKRPADAGGVIVSHVELGEKAQVAGLGLYMLITRVDGVGVKDLEDFKAKVSAVEGGRRKSVEFTLEMMGKTRLAKIEFAE